MIQKFAELTDPGVLRSVNQDSYYSDPDNRYFIVADGMGGHAGGQEASSIATQAIKDYLNDHWNNSSIPTTELLKNALEQANKSILNDQTSHPERGDMGTTVVMIAFREGKNWSAHIGDSRLYCFHQGKMLQITEDHTWVGRAMRSGDLTPEQAKTHPWRHVLSQCLGRRDLHHYDINSFEIEPGDVLLLCSDGLTEEVPDDLIQDYLKNNPDPQDCVKALIQAAKDAGGSDNITVILVYC